MEIRKKTVCVFALAIGLMAAYGCITGFIFYQMWLYGPVSFALLAVPLIIASGCIMFGIIRFIVSVCTMKSAQSFYFAIFDAGVLFLWKSRILNDPEELRENYSEESCGYSCITVKDCYTYCNSEFEKSYYEETKTDSRVCSWFMRIIFAIIFHYIWIMLLFCWLFAKAEKQLFANDSAFLTWYNESRIVPIDGKCLTNEDLDQTKEKLKETKLEIARAQARQKQLENDIKEINNRLYLNLIETLTTEIGPVGKQKYSLSHCNEESVNAFVGMLFTETYIYSDNLGPDARGLTHTRIVFDHIYKVDRAVDRPRYFALLQQYGKPISYPIGLRERQYPNITGSLPVLTSKFTAAIKESISLDTEKEILLVHGTKKEFIHSILCSGLQSSKSRKGLYGHGIYLTDSCQKADRYADHRDAIRRTTGLTMLVVRVALGNLKAYEENAEDFDSLVGGLGLDNRTRFREFIIRDDRRCCIEYIIHYHRE